MLLIMRYSERILKQLKPCFKNFSRLKSISCREIRIPVPWGHIAGKWWGPTDQRPILTLHGWQDNCGSFNRLIPLLNDNVGFLAIDFPGHGYSSRIPSGLYCYFTDYLLLVQYIINYFKWPKVSLLGHSMGGITSFTYAMINPENVDFIICIDGAKPMIGEDNVPKMQSRLLRFPKYLKYEMSKEEPPSYTIEEIKQKICAPNNNSVLHEYSHHLMDRNIAPSKINPRKYYFTRDPRLKTGELMNWPQEDSMEFAEKVVCPIFLCKAIGGSYYEIKKNFYDVLEILKRSSVDCQYHRLEGTHHIHLNNPEILAELVTKFIDKHNTADRDIGGLQKEMIQ